jgi:thioredoxin reductase (NADPH)
VDGGAREVLAGEVLSGAPGTTLLAEVRRTFPHAQRVLLIGWGRLGDSRTGDAIFEAISRGRMDHYVLRPAQPPDEQFHLAISSFLLAWAEARRCVPNTVDVVGEIWSGAATAQSPTAGALYAPAGTRARRRSLNSTA